MWSDASQRSHVQLNCPSRTERVPQVEVERVGGKMQHPGSFEEIDESVAEQAERRAKVRNMKKGKCLIGK